MEQKIVPNIWCQGTAEETGSFYAEAFADAGFTAASVVDSRYPTEGLLDFQRDLAGEALTVSVIIEGTLLVLINAGPEFSPNPSISFMLNFDPSVIGPEQAGGDAANARQHTIERIAQLWERLTDGGKVMMPLMEYPFSGMYGWVQDRYGVSWQLMLTNPEGEPRPFIIPALMFDGPAQDRAAEASDYYVKTFAGVPGGTAVGMQSAYGEPTGKASADALAFGEFRIGEQWFAVMDNGSGVDHGFTPAISLQVNCADQAEIDSLWDALSRVPEAEQCGWLADEFGVSWQIVPQNMEELMSRPKAFERMLEMKKLIIADF